MNVDVQTILAALNTLRIGPLAEEFEIHTAIQHALERADIVFKHEYPLGSGMRIDFLCGSIGVEVKKSRPVASKLLAQLQRYMREPSIQAMIVVMQKPCTLPKTICEKPVYVLALNRLWGVALG